ncbi:MAG: sigma-54 dependent transcriptional regulator [Amoebophilaceae bacterium]|nr:sigma-54 dependent transcriptional regulator [Amoebophilaceae bacterium]
MMKEELQSIKQRFNIIGNAPALNRAIQIAMQVASTDLSVLITGENGTGKESFSKIIHALSPCKHHTFIAINCGAIPGGTIDSELFGHEKGSFTGAIESRRGYFEEANGGTLFLDEIGDMPLSTQTKLLRVLEYGEYVKVGSSKVEKTKVRVVAATNVDLLQAIKQGSFREDLFYRLNTVPISIPPLRERSSDIILLFHKFSIDFAIKYRVKPLTLTLPAKELLLTYPFPGNIRQLKNIVEQISLLSAVEVVTPEVLTTYLPKAPNHMLPVLYKRWAGSELPQQEFLYAMLFDLKKDMSELKEFIFKFVGPGVVQNPVNFSDQVRFLGSNNAIKPAKHETIEAKEGILNKSIENFSIEAKEKELIYKSLEKNHGNRKHAATDLGISERTLYRKIKQYAIEENQFTQ